MKKAIGSVVLIAALVAGAQAITAAQKVVGGPFVVRVTGKTATVAWLVQTDEVRLQPETGVPITSPLIRVETTSFASLASRHVNNPHMTALTPMFEKYHVSAAFFGHDHNYQHYLKNSIHYVVTGGGGAPLYDVSKPAAGITQKVASVENFVGVSVNGKTVHFEAIAIDGSKLEEFDIESPVR